MEPLEPNPKPGKDLQDAQERVGAAFFDLGQRIAYEVNRRFWAAFLGRLAGRPPEPRARRRRRGRHGT